jgi:DegV family protein with EDD domain
MTDTTAGVNSELAAAHNIRLVPMHVIIDGKAYPETEIDLDWFCQQLPQWRAADRQPTTSAPAVDDFLAAYRELSREAEAVVDICLSSKFSATYSAALNARKLALGETPRTPFEVVDTLTVCGAQMLVAIEAARAASAGAGLEEVLARAEDITRRVNCVNFSSDVSLLAKSGRMHQARHLADSKVSNTMLMEVSHATGGEHKLLGRYRTRKQALREVVKIINERSGGRKLHFILNHAAVPDEAAEIKEQLLEDFSCAEFIIDQLPPLVTTHEWLGDLKFAWWHEE